MRNTATDRSSTHFSRTDDINRLWAVGAYRVCQWNPSSELLSHSILANSLVRLYTPRLVYSGDRRSTRGTVCPSRQCITAHTNRGLEQVNYAEHECERHRPIRLILILITLFD